MIAGERQTKKRHTVQSSRTCMHIHVHPTVQTSRTPLLRGEEEEGRKVGRRGRESRRGRKKRGREGRRGRERRKVGVIAGER